MKKSSFLFVVIILLSFTGFAWAVSIDEQGFYLGAQLGGVNLNNNNADNHDAYAIFFPASYLMSKIGGRAYVGYQFSKNYAIEAGYDGLADSSESGGISNKKNHTKVKGFDVVGKLIYPTKSGFGFYGVGGGAYIHQDILESTNGGSNVTYSSDEQKILPLLGAGLSFNFTSYLAADFSWRHMFGWSDIENIDFMALGLSYTF